MANLTKCLICGTRYPYCPSCAGTHAWKFYADTHEHYQIWMILNQLNSKQITTDEAREMFARIGITKNTNLSNLKPSIAEQIEGIVTVKVEPETVLKKTKKSKLYTEE